MAIVTRKTKAGPVHWVVTRGHYERIGGDRRLAERTNERRKKEVKAGTFSPTMSGATGVGRYLETWLDERKSRSVRVERSYFEHHILTRDWFCKMRIEDVAPRHVQRLIEEIKAEGKLSPKTISNVFAVLRTAFRAAQRADLVYRDVCLLHPGTISARSAEKTPYKLEEAQTLLATAVGARKVWAALAFYTGMRCGEVCGRRFVDWDRGSTPLGCLSVATQYDGQPLKTDAPRMVPIHPELAAILGEWWVTGFELTYCRKPTPEDFLVQPQGSHSAPLSYGGAFGAWNRDCKRAGVQNRTQHATRHTFITLARRGGAEVQVLEKVTHNAKGAIIDNYTHRDWNELCQAVLSLPSLIAARSESNGGQKEAVPSLAQEHTSAGNSAASDDTDGNQEFPETRFRRGKRFMGAKLAAGEESEARSVAVALVEHGQRAQVASLLAKPLAKGKPATYLARKREAR